MTKFERPRGTRDFGPAEMAERRWLEGVFRETFRRWGYREIQTPTFEHTALFEAKSGPNVVNEIYAFKDKGDRDICLRPELTAPVMRYYVNELTHEPKPLKLYYYGPCFRYEEPQEGRYREFWQFGLELLGPEGPEADAEVIAVAWRALRDAGLRKFILHVGHIGVLRSLMGALDASEQAKGAIYRAIDKDDPALPDLLEGTRAPPSLQSAILGVARHQRLVKPGEAAAVDAYFAKARDAVEAAISQKVLAPEAAQRVEKALADLRATVDLLAAHGVEEVDLDLGVARGLDYYTGMVFELEAPDLGAQKQIGGGGAYTLAELFGGEHVGSAGFGLGFDRILLALKKEGAVPAPAPVAQVYVATLGAGAKAAALRTAAQIRAAGASVEVDTMGRSLSKSLQHAAKLGARVVLIAGEKDLAQGNLTLRDMASGEQAAVPMAAAADEVLKRLGL
ncbi:MAG TPA: histidine--tRNA ligase [Candidatus Thermoplasmatota archaeon]|nr:histidine--tRNA ligase [Candidatus Thermoplasmatota archaeon]